MDSWVADAISDTYVVAKFLMELSQSNQGKSKVAPQPLEGFRRKRSRMITVDVIKESKKEESRPRRASPTTPLSWTDGSSTSSAGELSWMPQARAKLLSGNRKRKSNSKVDITQDKKLKFTIKAGKTKKNGADSQEELNNINMHKIFFRVPDLNLPPESED